MGAPGYRTALKSNVSAHAKRLFIHAPNIHTGGGLKLLQGVLTAAGTDLAGAQLDARAKVLLQVPEGVAVDYVNPTLWSRLAAEWRLRRVAPGHLIVCPHGLPPLFSLPARAAVLALNRLLVDGSDLEHFPWQPRLRIMIERLWLRLCQSHASLYVVQTASMATLFNSVLRPGTAVAVLPFDDPAPRQDALRPAVPTYDFLYPANGDAHKNHERVLEAWRLLASAGLKPSLALTINATAYPALHGQIAHEIEEHGLRITNLGYLTQPEMQELYAASGALLFPSLVESFGLPLIEARDRGLHIVAPELDYVRDVVAPAETFDPLSAVSMARAVRRLMGQPEPAPAILTTGELVAELLK